MQNSTKSKRTSRTSTCPCQGSLGSNSITWVYRKGRSNFYLGLIIMLLAHVALKKLQRRRPEKDQHPSWGNQSTLAVVASAATKSRENNILVALFSFSSCYQYYITFSNDFFLVHWKMFIVMNVQSFVVIKKCLINQYEWSNFGTQKSFFSLIYVLSFSSNWTLSYITYSSIYSKKRQILVNLELI